MRDLRAAISKENATIPKVNPLCANSVDQQEVMRLSHGPDSTCLARAVTRIMWHGLQALALLSVCEKQERNLQHIASNMPQCPAVTHEDCHHRDQQRSTSVSASFEGGSLSGDLRSSTNALHRGPSGQLAPSNPAAGAWRR